MVLQADFSWCCRGVKRRSELKATGDEHPARQITLKAAPVPSNPFERFIVLMDQIAGILVVVAPAWLVWTRPRAMSWGFFLYVIWFNPGQVYAFYALLQANEPAAPACAEPCKRHCRGGGICGAHSFRLARAGQ